MLVVLAFNAHAQHWVNGSGIAAVYDNVVINLKSLEALSALGNVKYCILHTIPVPRSTIKLPYRFKYKDLDLNVFHSVFHKATVRNLP